MKRYLSLFACWVVLVAVLPSSLRAQSLADALDATNLLWTAGGTGNKAWFGQTGITFDGSDAARSGAITNNEETWMETVVTGPGMISFWWKFKPVEAYYDVLEFYTNGTLADSITGSLDEFGDTVPVDWNYRAFALPAGSQTLRWRYARNADTGNVLNYACVDQVIYTTVAPIPLEQALDTVAYTWSSGGNTNLTYWIGQTNVTHDGIDAAQSGASYYGQESWMETTVSGATNVSFWWKVSSRTNDTFLEFYTNGVKKAAISGEVDWKSNSFALLTNSQTLRWRYVKTNSVPVGQDRGWVDQVVVTPLVFPPSITTQPTNQTILGTSNATFAVGAAGTAPLTYQWRCYGTNLTGATSNVLTLPNVQAINAGTYSVVVSNAYGFALSSDATLTVVWPPSIAVQPTNQTVVGTSNVTFNIEASGTEPLTYQWRCYGTNLTGATSNVFTLPHAQATDAGTYSVAVSNAYGFALSSNSTLIVVWPPSITTQPANRTALVGSDVTFSVGATGTEPLSYQWRFNSNDVAGATSDTFALSGVKATDAGDYLVVASNAYGIAVSSNATLTVNPLPVLTIDLVDAAVVVSWQSVYSNFGLESAGDLRQPAWTNVGAVIFTNGDTLSVTLPTTNVRTFYRLREN